MSATLDIPSILRDYPADEKNRLLAALLRERCGEAGQTVIRLPDVGAAGTAYLIADLMMEAREVVLDGSTPYLRELQRRVESPEDSVSLEEFMSRGQPSARS